jgi:tRNA-2-methylthio-N6-dimethylallyladenosine synthase
MRRSYRADKFLGVLDKVRQVMPEAAISTDIIVGFPGETEADFDATMEVVRAARFASAFTFQYSIRPGTPAAAMPDQIPAAVVTERFDRLVALQNAISEEENDRQIGREVEVLIAEGEGRKDLATRRVSGRARDGRLVHLAIPGAGLDLAAGVAPQAQADRRPRPGDIVRVRVTDAAPHHLMADSALEPGGLFQVRRTRAGDAWQRARAGLPEPRQSGRAVPLRLKTQSVAD